MTYTVRPFADAGAFLAASEPFLVREEAAHCLHLGLAAGLRDDPTRYGDDPPFFATIEDAGGEIVAAALRTSLRHNLVLSRAPLDALPALAAAVRGKYDTLPGLIAPTEIAAAFAAEWGRRSGQRGERHFAGRIHEIAQVTMPRPVAGAARRATEAERTLLVAWNFAFTQEAGLPGNAADSERAVSLRLVAVPETGGLWLWENGGVPVSLAGYGGPTPHGIRIGPVYTPPEHRGRGYASANVAALSQWLLDGGRRFCCLFTDLANPTANKVYRQIGYRPVCDVDEYAFADLPAPTNGDGDR